MTYLHAFQTISFIIFHTSYSPSGVIAQEKGLIEWVFLPNSFSKKLTIYMDKLAFLIQKGRYRILQLSGCEPHQTVTQLTTAQISRCLQFNENWQISLASYPDSCKIRWRPFCIRKANLSIYIVNFLEKLLGKKTHSISPFS